MAGGMTCDFTFPAAVNKSYQDDRRVTKKGCVQPRLRFLNRGPLETLKNNQTRHAYINNIPGKHASARLQYIFERIFFKLSNFAT